MTQLNVARRKADTATMVNEDPWNITVHRKGETPDDPPVLFSFVGRVQPAGMRSVAVERWSVELRGEHTVGRYSHAILAAAGTPKILDGDTIVAVSQLDAAVSRTFRAVYSSEYSYKLEALVDELE